MRKDITKKFLGKENRHIDKMLSEDVVSFILRKSVNWDAKQISYDVIGFRNVFSIEFTDLNTNNILESGYKIKEVVSKDGKSIGFNMIYCIGDESHSDFLLSEIEVTQELYEFVMDCNFSKYSTPSCYKMRKDSSKRPVEGVSWYDAVLFCNELSLLTNRSPYYEIKDMYRSSYDYGGFIYQASVKMNGGANGFRLPLSKEWEYAARAGTNNKYAGTNDERNLGEYAWFRNVFSETHPVATKKPNEWGFYDMSGNVAEWCEDHVHRGGSFSSGFEECNLLHSSRLSDASGRSNCIGIRVAAYF